jgi:hypothetical protein
MSPSVKIQKMSLTAAAVVREGANVTHSFGPSSGALEFMWGISESDSKYAVHTLTQNLTQHEDHGYIGMANTKILQATITTL